MTNTTLKEALNDCKSKTISIIDQNNFSIAHVITEKARENTMKLYGHLKVLRVGEASGITAIRVSR